MKILFVGDWAPGTSPVRWSCVDERVFLNLEGPILDNYPDVDEVSHYQSKKAGPLLWTSSVPNTKSQLIINLANNHFMDFGVLGAQETLSKIQHLKALTIGYGENRKLSQRPLRMSIQGRSISIVAACENQFGIADSENQGVAGLGNWIYPTIKAEKSISDFVVVSFHGGVEDHPLPSPFYQDLYRSFVDLGADLVIGHHPHTPQGYEFYDGSCIAYGLGNFAVNPNVWASDPLHLISLGIRVDFSSEKPIVSVTYFQAKDSNSEIEVKEVDSDLRRALDEYFTSLNAIIAVRDDLELIWKNVASQLWDSHNDYFLRAYTRKLSGTLLARKFVKHRLNLRKVKESIKEITCKNRLLSYHAINCETHREVITTTLSGNHKLLPEEVLKYNAILPKFLGSS